MRRRFVALTLVPLLLFGSACGEGGGNDSAKQAVDMGEPIENVSVSGEVGKPPEVKIDGPLKLDKTQSQVITAGEGNPVVEGEKAVVHLYLANGTSGKKALTTYDQGQPVALEMKADQLFPAVVDAIVDKPTGSRVVVATVPKDAYGEAGAPQIGLKGTDNAVFVVDILSVEPTEVVEGPDGSKVDAPSEIPTIEEKDGNVTKLTFENAPKQPPGELQVIPLIEGEGPPVRDDSLVSFDYFGQVYGTDKVFDESYTKEPVPFPVGVGGLIKAWDEGLVGLNRGSRVLIIAPPDVAYGPKARPGIPANSTLTFVVDILGVDPAP